MDLRFQLRLREDQRGVPQLSAHRLPVIPVACGVLQNGRGEVLLAQRPQGKIAAGYWEFPGGKIEPGESASAALARELHEELGIAIRRARPLIRLRHAYRDRVVILHTWLVTAFDNEPQGRERQVLAWVPPERIAGYRVLPTVAPILPAVELPADYAFTRPSMSESEILAGLAALPAGALLRLRLPGLGDRDYAELAAALRTPVAQRGLKLVLDRAPELTRRLGAWAHHYGARAWSALSQPLPPTGFRRIGSAHSRQDLLRLRALGLDAAVLGHVADTPTHAGEPPLGWSGFACAVAEIGFPVFAIGGVGPAQQAEAFASGAQGTAGIGAYWSRRGSAGSSGSEPDSCSTAGMLY